MSISTSPRTRYLIKNIEEAENVKGLLIADLARISDHGLRDIENGGSMENSSDFHKVILFEEPEVGVSLRYHHPLWAGCISSRISHMEEIEDQD